jgi:hypothetical protein
VPRLRAGRGARASAKPETTPVPKRPADRARADAPSAATAFTQRSSPSAEVRLEAIWRQGALSNLPGKIATDGKPSTG